MSSFRPRPKKHVSAIRISVFSAFVASCPILARRNLEAELERRFIISRRNSSTSDCDRKLGTMTYPSLANFSRMAGDKNGGRVAAMLLVLALVVVSADDAEDAEQLT